MELVELHVLVENTIIKMVNQVHPHVPVALEADTKTKLRKEIARHVALVNILTKINKLLAKIA
jgi:hypothetical protein